MSNNVTRDTKHYSNVSLVYAVDTGNGVSDVSTHPNYLKEREKFMKVLGRRIALIPCEEAKMSTGGIALPDVMDNSKDEGIVIAVGEGYMLADGTYRALSVKIGDRVKFAQYGAAALEVEGKTVLIITEDDVLAITQEA